MRPRDLIILVTLGVLWGVSFLFIRVAAPEFGAVALMAVRVVMATLVLLPLLVTRGDVNEVVRHWRPILLIGVLHYALPFCLFAYAMLTLTSGFAAIINASSPLFAGAVACVWLSERLTAVRIAGLLVGFAGVVILVWDKAELNSGPAALAIGAAVLAAACYGLAAVLAKRQLAGVSPVAISAGSMLAASFVLVPLATWHWPATMPSTRAWVMAALLGFACTAIAFLLYFRLIANVGPTRAITVTFLIPVFAILFGAVFLDEPLSASMIVGGAVILLGTAMSTGLLAWSSNRHGSVIAWSRQS
jgi:drug/metabolite transporter (DMT)-like permease